jgi:hypothetical protein
MSFNHGNGLRLWMAVAVLQRIIKTRKWDGLYVNGIIEYIDDGW